MQKLNEREKLIKYLNKHQSEHMLHSNICSAKVYCSPHWETDIYSGIREDIQNTLDDKVFRSQFDSDEAFEKHISYQITEYVSEVFDDEDVKVEVMQIYMEDEK